MYTDLLRPFFSSLLLPTPLVLDRPLFIWALHDEGDALDEEDLAPFFPSPLLLALAFLSVRSFWDCFSFVAIVLVQCPSGST